jgi:hypothetical protein
MKLKTTTLTVLAAVAVMAFAGTAAATKITSPTGTTSTAAGKVEAEGHLVFDNPIAKIECAASAQSQIESHGAGVPAKGNLTSLTFTNCTNSWHVTTVTAGSSSINHTSGYNGTLSSGAATIEATRFGILCRYATGGGTSIGTITSGSPATVDLAAAIPFHSGSALCGEGTTTLTGTLKGSTSTGMFIDA